MVVNTSLIYSQNANLGGGVHNKKEREIMQRDQNKLKTGAEKTTK